MRTVYIGHPLGQDGSQREINRANAMRWCGWLALNFKIAPIADWIILSGVWSETRENRARGLAVDVELVARADEVWLVGGRVTRGMQVEAEKARELSIPVFDLTELGFECPGDHDSVAYEKARSILKIAA